MRSVNLECHCQHITNITWL